MKHSEKIKLARRMPRTAQDEKDNEGLFTTEAWEARKVGIAGRVKRQQDRAHAGAVARREALKGTPSPMTRLKKRILATIAGKVQARSKRHARYLQKNTV